LLYLFIYLFTYLLPYFFQVLKVFQYPFGMNLWVCNLDHTLFCPSPKYSCYQWFFVHGQHHRDAQRV